MSNFLSTDLPAPRRRQEQARRPEGAVQELRVLEVRELRAREVRRAEHLAREEGGA